MRLAIMQFSRILIAIIVLLSVAGCTSLTSLFFYPQTVWIQTPEAYGLEYQDVFLEADDNTELHAWFMPGQPDADTVTGAQALQAQEWVVLYLHGNAENISSHYRNMIWMVKSGFSVLALDYRGFGASQGRAIMPDVLMDVEAAAHWLQHRYPDKKTLVLGQSIGAVLAINFVAAAEAQYGIDALVVDAPFRGFRDIARNAIKLPVLSWILWPVAGLIPATWDPEDKAQALNLPVLVMHSQDDAIIPYQHGRRVFTQLPENNRCWLESEGRHIASFTFREMRQAVLEFVLAGTCTQPTNLTHSGF